MNSTTKTSFQAVVVLSAEGWVLQVYVLWTRYAFNQEQARSLCEGNSSWSQIRNDHTSIDIDDDAIYLKVLIFFNLI